MEDNFPTDPGNASGGNASDGERWGAAHEASLARPPLTSCRATGRGRVLQTPGIQDREHEVIAGLVKELFFEQRLGGCRSLDIWRNVCFRGGAGLCVHRWNSQDAGWVEDRTENSKS